MRISGLYILLLLYSGVPAQTASEPIFYVKHLEPPLRYPVLARYASLQGNVTLRLTIADDGTVSAVIASADNQHLNEHPVLQSASTDVIKKWTFGCFNCVPNAPHELLVKFHYKIEGDPKAYDDTTIDLDLPTDVTVKVSPAQCDHCPPPRKESKQRHGNI